MANAVITVLEADGVTQTDVVVLDVARQAAAASKSVATCTEDKAVLDAMATSLTLLDDAIIADDAAFTPATTKVLMVGAEFDDVAPDSVNEGDAGAVRMSANRNLYTTIRDAAGNERGLNIDASGQLAVTLASAQTLGTVTTVTTVSTLSGTTSLTPGTAATNLGKAIDTVAGPTDTGVAALVVRDDALTTLTPVDGDFVPQRTNARGATWIAIEDGAGGQVTAFSGGTQYTEDAAAAANPVGPMMMAVRRDTLSASEVSAEDDNIALKASSKGQLNVILSAGDPGVTANRTTVGTMANGFLQVGWPSDNALPAGTNHLGQVQTAIQFVDVTMTPEATALDVGDVVCATQIVAACTRANDVPAILHSMTLIDVADQKAKLRIVLFDANTVLGTEDAAPDIDDTEALTVQGFIDIAVADYVDLGANSVVHKTNLGIVVKPATGTDDIYMAIYSPDTSTPTYGATNITVRLGFI